MNQKTTKKEEAQKRRKIHELFVCIIGFLVIASYIKHISLVRVHLSLSIVYLFNAKFFANVVLDHCQYADKSLCALNEYNKN